MNRFIVSALVFSVSAVAGATPWVANVNQEVGLPALSVGGRSAVSSAFVFWGKAWAWAPMQSSFKVLAPFQYGLSGTVPALGLTLNGGIRRVGAQQFVWDLDLSATALQADVIGGGIAFKFDLPAFSAELGEPELLADRRGWAWGSTRIGSRRVEMRFDPPLAAVYFESGRKNEIRALFFSGSIPAGLRDQKATLTVFGDIATGPTLGERFGLDNVAAWPGKVVDYKSSPVNLSFLNAGEKPAGRRGFVKAAGDRLVFGDGTQARFWGTNLTAYALFATPREAVIEQARRLSALGFNLVRIHHHDSSWVNPNVFGDRQLADGSTLSPAMLEKIDWWIKCLKDEGIYVWLDLHVGRQLTQAMGIDGFAEISKGKPAVDLKGYNYVNASIQRKMKQFAEAYLGRANVHTGVLYKDEPAVVAVLVTNENDLTHHFGNALLPDKNVPIHSALYMAQANAFAARFALPQDKTWRAWEHGPSKLFLNDLEQRFSADAMAHLSRLGIKVPMVNTSMWGFGGLSTLPVLTEGGMIDAHSYGGVGDLEKDPMYGPNLLHWIASAQVVGKPLSVTEWNVEHFPAPDRHAIPLYVASTARHQGWDAMMQYAYSQAALSGPGSPSNWHAFNDPALLATMPAAALLYRQQHVREAITTYVFAPTREQLFFEPISPDNSVALRTAMEKGKLQIAMPATRELPWLERSAIPAGAKVIIDPDESQIPAGAVEAKSDTGELARNWEQGVHTIQTLRTQAAMGWIGGRKIAFPQVQIAVSTRNATVAVQSLDGLPLGLSRRVLISLGARAVPQASGQLPFRSEFVEGQVTIRAPRGLRLYPKPGAGVAPPAIEVPYVNGSYVISLTKALGTYWLVLGDDGRFS